MMHTVYLAGVYVGTSRDLAVSCLHDALLGAMVVNDGGLYDNSGHLALI